MVRSRELGRHHRALALCLSHTRPAPSPCRASVFRNSLPKQNSRYFSHTTQLFEKKLDQATSGRRLVRTSHIQPCSNSARDLFSQFAFAFDIDGVLYQGGQGIPGAGQMLRKLRSRDVKYVFLTNGGGTHEESKAKSLMKRLDLLSEEDIVTGRMILSHTPMRGWDQSLKENGTVLITGHNPELARSVARDYGFKHVVTPADILAADPKVYPFAHLKDSLHKKHEDLPAGKKLLRLQDPYTEAIPPDLLKIDKIMIWNDPRDWSLDIQLIYDLLISRQGYVGTISDRNGDASLPNNGWQQDGQPEVWISNMDLFWKTEYQINRFGTGAFVDALRGVWYAATGAKLQYQALGKPSQLTYAYAHNRLMNGGLSDASSGTKQSLKRIYMIGDNPDSDIRGANEFQPEDGTEWLSILVRTGVWKKTAQQQKPKYQPTVIVDDVVDAIAWAMRNEGLDVDRNWVLSR